MTNPNVVYKLQTAATSDNGLNGAQRLNGALAVERFELTIIPPNVLARADRVIT
jgi:hypothetical protein